MPTGTVVRLSCEHREQLCSIKPVTIPRPSVATMRFVTVAGHRGYYLTVSKKKIPKRPCLDLKDQGTFQKPVILTVNETPVPENDKMNDNKVTTKVAGLITCDPKDIPPPDYDDNDGNDAKVEAVS